MYPWLIFLHVLGAFGFLLAHGAQPGDRVAAARRLQPGAAARVRGGCPARNHPGAPGAKPQDERRLRPQGLGRQEQEQDQGQNQAHV